MSVNFLSAKYNRADFLSFLTQKFLPVDFEQTQSNIYIDRTGARINSALKLGSCLSIGTSIYEFRHNSNHDPRVTLSRESFNILNKNEIEPNALAVFYNEDTSQWRLSLITSDFTFGKKKGSVKKEFSNPRRYSYILGKDCKLHTPSTMLNKDYRVKSTEDLVSRFAIEVVTKQFYKDLFNWYDSWAVNIVKFPVGSGKDAKLPLMPNVDQNRQHLIRLVTRLIFIWFLRQKNDLVPSWLFDEKIISKILNKFDSKSSKQGNYYNGIIQNLFFATLNKPIKERKFANSNDDNQKEDYGIKTVFRDFNDKSLFLSDYSPSKYPDKLIKMFDSIPFLNGGLFECLDDFDTKEYVDGFSREQNRAAFVPNCLFFGDNEHEGLIPLLERYNFTVEENTAQDIDIALDPELLGKVFENLLGTYNEETRGSARNESGSFYTPREIVDFMVDASLKEYLKGKLNLNETDSEEKFDILFSYDKEQHNFNEGQVKLLMDAIGKCKILDPACGSGAFPMGILNKLSFIMEKLDPKNEIWRQIQISQATEDTKKAFNLENKETRAERLKEIQDIFEMSTGEYSNYARKLFLIENCIYGVDIQPIAIQISKLRFFISLIVDQRAGGNIDNNYNVRPLPNLETKFVAANSLIGFRQGQMELIENDIAETESQLLSLRHSHFATWVVKDKIKIRKQDKELSNKLISLLEKGNKLSSDDAKKLTSWDPYKQTKPADFFFSKLMFNVDSFDLVIGNPPYIQLSKNQSKLADIYSNSGFECFSRSGDIYQLFYEFGYKLLSNKGHLCFITSNKWMRAAYGEKTRKFFALKSNPKLLIDFSSQHVFETATVDVNILLIQKAANQQNTQSCIIKEKCKNNMTFVLLG